MRIRKAFRKDFKSKVDTEALKDTEILKVFDSESLSLVPTANDYSH